MPRRSSPTPRRSPAALKERGADLVAGGTDTHLALVDLRPARLTGKDADESLERAGITCNKNGVPFDPAAAGQDQRHPRRLAGRDHPRLRRGRVPRHRRHGRRRARRACARTASPATARSSSEVDRRVRDALRPLPDLSGLRMRCPFCAHEDSQVKDSRPSEDGAAIRRRRQCEGCGARFTTFERVQLRDLTVVKKDGKREPFDRAKLERAIGHACRKRDIDAGQDRPAGQRRSAADGDARRRSHRR